MDVTSVCEAIGRIISVYLRTPSPMSNREKLEHVVEQLSGILGSNMSHGFGPNRVMSLPDAVAKALRRYLDGEGSVADKAAQWNRAEGTEEKSDRPHHADLCPECGQATLVNQSGCYSCLSCGYAKCS